MATCTYQEEPPWLDYPTVRHAKRWPSLDLVTIFPVIIVRLNTIDIHAVFCILGHI